MKIITICGSLKFQKEMMELSEKLEFKGFCVLSPVYPIRNIDDYSKDEIMILNKAHKEKIKISDAILVLDIGGRIGSSTRGEIEFARALNKKILYYSDLNLKV